MNRNLRLKMEESIKTRKISENICFLCLACLNDKITYSKKVFPELEKQRNIIATAVLKNGGSKTLLIEKIQIISKQDYPTFKAIMRIVHIIESNNYFFVDEFITNQMIHYKNADELSEDAKRVIPQKKVDILETEEFKQVCSWIEKYVDITITDKIKQKIKLLGKYNVILQCCLWNKENITEAINRKVPFASEYDKFRYFLGIIKNCILETEKELERRKKAEDKLWLDNAQVIIDGGETLESMIFLQCEKYSNAAFYGKKEYVREKLQEAIKRLKEQKF